jgi:hypothetical protein
MADPVPPQAVHAPAVVAQDGLALPAFVHGPPGAAGGQAAA